MFDFDKVNQRRGTGCVKWDNDRDGVIPMWVADMDFQTAPCIVETLRERVNQGIFGYTHVQDSYYDAISSWFSRKHGWNGIRKEWIIYTSGVVPALSATIKAMTKPGDKVLIQTPVYNCFFSSIRNNGCTMLESRLVYDYADDNSFSCHVDFDDFESKVKEAAVFVLCNPHNPVGRVWTKEELEKMGDICLKHNVVIMDDEIHCDFTYPGFKFTSFMTLDEKYHNSLVLYTSPSKTFNVAGLQPANIIIKNPELRAAYRKANAAAGYSQGSIMGQVAVKSVYTKGDEWVNELVEYITGNMNYMRDFVKENFPKAHFVDPEGTYLTWVDFSGYGFTDEELEHIRVEEAHLWLDSGKVFGPATAQFERFNLACPRATVVKAMEQLKTALDNHTKWA